MISLSLLIFSVMEPEDVSDYSKAEYWDKRYTAEEAYDWFSSVYEPCVEELAKLVVGVAESRPAEESGKPVRVLHLGCGNSALCADLLKSVTAKQPELVMQQQAMDYSEVVIANMEKKYAGLPGVEWVVGDIRTLEKLPNFEAGYDVVIDKGTMDALQADKENDDLDDMIEQMLNGVSKAMTSRGGKWPCFAQVTWEVPYYRLHHTKKDQFCWNDNIKTSKLGGSDMYYLFIYRQA